MELPSIEDILVGSADGQLLGQQETSKILTQNQNVVIGVYLIIAGILTILLNGSILATMSKFQGLLNHPYRQLIFHFTLGIMGMTLFGGFLLSGSSSLAGHWLFGNKGCKLYGFAGFFFGLTNVTLICSMCITRYLLGKKKSGNSITASRIQNVIYFCWIWGLIWSICPLLGWSSYDFEPTGTTCTINWTNNDSGYVSYILCMMFFVFLIPTALMIVFNWMALKETKQMKRTGQNTQSENSNNDIGQMDGVKMCILLVTLFLLCWSGYAILCTWVIFYKPEDVPEFFVVSPPLFAKFSSVAYPIAILYYDKALRQSVYSWLFCKNSTQEFATTRETTRMTSDGDED